MWRGIMAATLAALTLATHNASAPPSEWSGQTPVAMEQVCNGADNDIEAIAYGKSGQGRDLVCYRIGDGGRKLLLTFAMHGFEDQAPHDGVFLRDMAEALKSTAEVSEDWSLYIIPMVNPDGVTGGWTNNGPGRC